MTELKSAKGHAKNARNQLDALETRLRTADPDNLERVVVDAEDSIAYALDEIVQSIGKIDNKLEEE